MLRILHLADVHLDTTFLCRDSELRSRLRQSLRDALAKAVKTAIHERLDAVIVAGDLFDGDRLSFETERFLLQQFTSLNEAGIPCLYATGNHDASGGNQRFLQISWPPNLHFIGEPDPKTIELRERGGKLIGKIVAAGHRSSRESENLARSFPVSTGDPVHIGILHTLVTTASGIEQHDRFAPCTAEDLRQKNYNYWALGHIHLRQSVDEDGRMHYPGNLIGRNPRETGSKGGLLVTLRDQDPPQVDFLPLASLRWETIRFDKLSEVSSLAQLDEMVKNRFESFCAEAEAETDWMLRFVFSGASPLAQQLNDPEECRVLEESLTDLLDVLGVEVRTEHLTPPIDLETFREGPHLLAEVLSLIEELRDDPSQLERIAPTDLAGCRSQEDRALYLRHLMEGLDRESARRLLKPSSPAVK